MNNNGQNFPTASQINNQPFPPLVSPFPQRQIPLFVPAANFPKLTNEEEQLPIVKQGAKILAGLGNSLDDLLIEEGKLDNLLKESEQLDKEEEKRKKKLKIIMTIFILSIILAAVAFVVLAIINYKRNEEYRNAKDDITENGKTKKLIEDNVEYTYTNKDNIIEKTTKDPKTGLDKVVATFEDKTADCTPIVQGVAGSLLGASVLGAASTAIYSKTQDDNVLDAIKEERAYEKNSIETNAKIRKNKNLLHGDFAETLSEAYSRQGKQIAQMVGDIAPVVNWSNFYNKNIQNNPINGQANAIFQAYQQQNGNYFG